MQLLSARLLGLLMATTVMTHTSTVAWSGSERTPKEPPTEKGQNSKSGYATGKSPEQQSHMDRAREKALAAETKPQSGAGKATGKTLRKDESSECSGKGCGTAKDMGPGYDKVGRPHAGAAAPGAPSPPKDRIISQENPKQK